MTAVDANPRIATQCPECGSRFRAARGAVVACPGCGNPVEVNGGDGPRDLAQRRKRDPGGNGRRRGRSSHRVSQDDPVANGSADGPRLPWAKILLVAAVLIAAHVGVGFLLTSGARSEIHKLEARHTPADLAGAERPGPAPEAGTDAYENWARRDELFTAKERLAERREEIDVVNRGVLVALLIQMIILTYVTVRAWRSQQRAALRA